MTAAGPVPHATSRPGAIGGALRETVAGRLRAGGQRFTRSRADLLEILADADRPLTIPEILNSGTGLAQSSAYRNLLVLESAGVVRRIVTHDDFARYELAEDLTGHHHHLVCSRCGLVEDVPASASLERTMAGAAQAAARRTGFTVHQHRLDLVGVCRDCG